MINEQTKKPHPHADVLIAFAKGAAMEYQQVSPIPVPIKWFTDEANVINPISYPNLLWRIKPKTHWINGIECPAPLKTLVNVHVDIFVADPGAPDFFYEISPLCNKADQVLSRGLAHSTKEAAIANSNAMVAFKDKP